MIAICNKSYFDFKKGENYKVEGIYSIFVNDDFISLNNNGNIYRFRLNKNSDYIDDYIGTDEAYFYDYFTLLKDERKKKLVELQKD